MRTKNLTPFPFGAKVTSREPPRPEMTLILRGAFTLRPGEPVAALEGIKAQGPMRAETFHEDDEERAGECLYPGDFADFKPRADVMLRGTCHAPRGEAVTECPVRFSVGSWSKVLRVIGTRAWSDTKADAVMSRPLPFRTMAIGYPNAFGGPGFAPNPVGRGYGTDALPNVEHPDAFVRSRRDLPVPAGFGPINPAWPQRSSKMGKEYGPLYALRRAPYYAEDFSFSYFNAAPADQQIPYLRGDEEVRFENLHPTSPVFAARLPGLRIRAFVKDVEGRFREVAMQLDTLFADLEEEKLFLTWRGLDPVKEDDLSDVATVLVASEPLGVPALPEEHYRDRLEAFEKDPLGFEERLGPERYALMKDAQAGKLQRPTSPEETRALLARLDRIAGPAGGPPLAEQVGGALGGAPPGFDLGNLLAKAANEPAPLPPVVPPAPGGPPTAPIGDVIRMIRREVDKLKAVAANEKISIPGLDDLEALTNDPQLAALDPSLGPAGAAADPEEEPGPGKNLTGRDLSGQDLHGKDLRGADLTGANLRSANLRDAKLAGATLKHAVLFQADLAGADLSGANLTFAVLVEARAPDVDLRGATLDRASFHRADLDGANLTEARGELVVFKGANLTGARAKDADLRMSIFEGATLERADFSGATLVRCLVTKAKAKEARFTGATVTRTSFAESDLTLASFAEARGDETRWMRATLAGTDFGLASLQRAHFTEAVGAGTLLRGADLRRARFYRASFEGADLRQANLFSADLSKGRFTGARFTGASLYDAKLRTAVVDGCDFAGANLARCTLPAASQSAVHPERT
jgi:uncharacterized protein YjbI with pentapeptide repeats